MKITAHTKTMSKTIQNIIAVVTALTLVFLQMPIFNLAQEARAAAASDVAAQVEQNGSVDVSFTFDHAFIRYDGQVIAPPASKVTLPAGASLSFSAEADSGYELSAVEAVLGGTRTTLAPDGDGVYKISSDALAVGGASVSVVAVSLPEAEEAEGALEGEESVGAVAAEAAEAEGAAAEAEGEVGADAGEADAALEAEAVQAGGADGAKAAGDGNDAAESGAAQEDEEAADAQDATPAGEQARAAAMSVSSVEDAAGASEGVEGARDGELSGTALGTSSLPDAAEAGAYPVKVEGASSQTATFGADVYVMLVSSSGYWVSPLSAQDSGYLSATAFYPDWGVAGKQNPTAYSASTTVSDVRLVTFNGGSINMWGYTTLASTKSKPGPVDVGTCSVTLSKNDSGATIAIAERELPKYTTTIDFTDANIGELTGSYYLLTTYTLKNQWNTPTSYYALSAVSTASAGVVKVEESTFTGKSGAEVVYYDASKGEVSVQLLKAVADELSLADAADGANCEVVEGSVDGNDVTVTPGAKSTAITVAESASYTATASVAGGGNVEGNFYVLASFAEGDDTYYCLQPFVTDGSASKFYKFQTIGGKTAYYSGERDVDVVLLKAAGEGLTVVEALAASGCTAYKPGQIVSGHLFSLGADSAGASVLTFTNISASGTTHTATLQFYEPTNAKAFNENTTGKLTSLTNPAIESKLVAVARLTPAGTGSKGTVAAWQLAEVNVDALNAAGAASIAFEADEYVTCDASGEALDELVAFDSELFDVSVMLYQVPDGNYTTYNQVVNAGSRDIDGYRFLKNTVSDDKASSRIALAEKYASELVVRLNIDPSGTVLKKEDLYLLVTLEHASGNPTYFFKKLAFEDQSQVDITVDELVDQNGQAVDDYFTDGVKNVVARIVKSRANSGELTVAGAIQGNNCQVLQDGQSGGSLYIVKNGVYKDGGSITDDVEVVSSETSQHTTYILPIEAKSTFTAVQDGLDYMDVLGNARYFGIVANEWDQYEAETNAAVKKVVAHQQSGNDLVGYADASYRQMWYVGQVEGELHVKGDSADVYAPADQQGKITNMTIGDLNFVTTDKSAIDAYIDKMLGQAAQVSAELATRNSAADASAPISMITSQKLELDLTPFGPGTVYISLDSKIIDQNGQERTMLDYISSEAEKLHLTKRADQLVVFTSEASTVNLAKFQLVNGANSADSATIFSGKSDVYDNMAASIIWNFPNATQVNFGGGPNGSVAGVFLAPQATVNINDTGAGWILADKVVNQGGKEWHSIWQRYDQDYEKTSAAVNARKKLDGANPGAQAFTFVLTDASGAVLEVAQNTNAGAVNFSSITFEEPGSFTYIIREVTPENCAELQAAAPDEMKDLIPTSFDSALSYDNAVHTATVTVLAAGEGKLTATTKYDGDEQGEGGTFVAPTFNNASTIDGGMTSATVVKKWDDADNRDGKRPEELKVTLSAEPAVELEGGGEVVLSAANGWMATVEGLPEYVDGKAVEYTWTEDEAGLPEGYALSGAVTAGTVTTLTNTYTPEVTEASVVKVWDDDDNAKNRRPESVKVALSDGTAVVYEAVLNADNDWTATKTGLPKYAGGKEIAYTWTEDEAGLPEGYALSGASTAGTVTTLTNTYTQVLTEATVKKVWEHGDNDVSRVPTELKVALSNGAEVVLNEDNGWEATVDGLPKYGDDGKEIAYTWSEPELPEGYALSGTSKTGTVTTLTNTYTAPTVAVTVHKVWLDADNAGKTRPTKLVVKLLADGKDTGESVTLKADDDPNESWTASIAGLPRYDGADEITYTWAEAELPEGYALEDASANGAVTTITNKAVTEASVKKVWDDADNADGTRPAKLEVALLADGADTGKSVTLSADNDWTASLSELDKYDADGKEIAYSWQESGLPDGYTLTNEKAAGTQTTLTNSYSATETSASVKKVWDDGEDQDGLRPQSIEVKLLADGADTGKSVTLSADNNWAGTIGKLQMNKDGGAKISYTWSEAELPDGYELTGTEADGTLTTLTNTHEVTTTGASVKKVWADNADAAKRRPAELEVALLADGADTGKAVTLSADNNWTASLDKLDKYNADGNEVRYTWSEAELPDGYELTGAEADGTLTALTNTYTAPVVSAQVKKVWEDADDQDGMRPSELAVTLSAEPAVALENDGRVELSAATGWSATVEGLPKYDSQGKAVSYSWTEAAVDGYTAAAPEVTSATDEDGNVVGSVTTLTNRHTTATTRATVNKVWEDASGAAAPENLVVTLTGIAEGAETTVVHEELNEANGWSATVEDLPKYADGREVSYTWAEGASPAGYTQGVEVENEEADGALVGSITTFTNTYRASGEAKFSAKKVLAGKDSKTQPVLESGMFQFTLDSTDEGFETQTVSNVLDTVEFEPIAYDETSLGEHVYTISEVAADAAGIAYDKAVHEVRVFVSDADHDGALEVTYNGSDTLEDIVFTNVYEATGETELQAEKLVDGALATEAGAYEFELTDASGKVVATAKNDENGLATFEGLKFDSVGTYRYTIHELVPAGWKPAGSAKLFKNVAYDERTVYAEIEVRDNGDGTLGFDKKYTDESGNALEVAQFNNTTVASARFSLEATKVMQGRDFREGDEFTFVLTRGEGSEQAPLPATTTATITPEGGSVAAVNFGEVEFTSDDIGNTYRYYISEQAVEPNEDGTGVVSDGFNHYVDVSVSGGDDGQIAVSAAYENDASGIVITNTYTAAGEAQLFAQKTLQGRALAANEFFFTLSGGGLEAPLHAGADADGRAEFAAIRYTQADAGKDFTYTITEDKGELPGVTYDEHEAEVTVHVEDNGDGTLAVTYDGEPEFAGAAFTNTYTVAPVSVGLVAQKALAGAELAEGQFSFTLSPVSDNAPGAAQTVSNAADGTVAFEAVDYTEPGTYEYAITEVVPAEATDNGDGTWTSGEFVYDGMAHAAVVTVAQNALGELEASVSYDGQPSLTITNSTTELATAAGLEFDKYYYGGTGTFNFALVAASADGSERAGEAVEFAEGQAVVDDGTAAFTLRAQNGAFADGKAKVAFPEISYAADGDYYYLVYEDEQDTADMVVDKARYLVHVAVQGGEASEPVYELVYEGENLGATDDHSFYNNAAVKLGFSSLAAQSYGIDGERVSVYPQTQKYLNGDTVLLVGGDFEFQLVDKATGTEIARATNDENGVVAFFDETSDPGLAYDEPGVYSYIIREVAGDEAGITYDASEISLVVTVEQTDEGLEATMAYNGPGGAEPAFYNTKEGMDVRVQKVSRSGGEGLPGSTYALYLVGEGGDALVQEAVSDAQGYITFTDVDLMKGQKYYFKEVAAPSGHTVDPYRSAYFTLNDEGTALVLAEETAADGVHSATEAG